jgi:hypothetical protein
MLPKIGTVSVIAALLGGVFSLPANATTVIYSLEYTQTHNGGSVPVGTIVGTGTLTLNLPSSNVGSSIDISSGGPNAGDFVSFTNLFTAGSFNFSLGSNDIGIKPNANDALNSFSFNGSANGDNISLGLTSFSLSGPGGLNEGGGVTVLSFGPAVPEPSTWAMMILGFAGIGAMTCRRRKSAMLAA